MHLGAASSRQQLHSLQELVSVLLYYEKYHLSFVIPTAIDRLIQIGSMFLVGLTGYYMYYDVIIILGLIFS
jgi:hypothetical protein